MIPGPDWAFLLSAGSTASRVGSAVGGLMIGYAIITIAVAVGLGTLIATVPIALTAVAILGAGYLVYLGAAILRARPAAPAALQAGRSSARRRGGPTLIRGIGVSALNPKALLFFLAILPLFVRSESPLPATMQLGVYGAVYIIVGSAFYLLLGTLAKRLSRTARTGIVVNRISGALMILIGVAILVEQVITMTPAV
ncbi:LysE family translocator [Microbacterium sp.]|uniref:LysE family translocator n=1 Tax=Microbacterium sp. TaxID=51671 RepID=UPI0037CAB40B